MNKYIIIVIILVLIIGGGAFYRANFVADIDQPITTGVERNITIIVSQNTWRFEPENIEIDQGDKLILTVVNRDEYDHGFAIDAYGISQRMPALSTIQIDFVATRPGDFPYYCSVSCGSGIVDGEKRGHFDQIGKLSVRSLISETSGLQPPTSREDFVKEARQASYITTGNVMVNELGYDLTQLEAIVDEGNVLWTSYATSNNIDPESQNLPAIIDYQAIVYRDELLNPVLFVFLDNIEGEVISAFEVGK